MPRKPQVFQVQKPVASTTTRREYSLTQLATGTALIEIDGNSVREASEKTEIHFPTLSQIRKPAVSQGAREQSPIK